MQILWDFSANYRVANSMKDIIDKIIGAVREIDGISEEVCLEVAGRNGVYLGEKLYRIKILSRMENELKIKFRVIYYFYDKNNIKVFLQPDDFLVKISINYNERKMNILIGKLRGFGRVSSGVIGYLIVKKLSEKIKLTRI
ncbi:MAG: hypothetical protein DRJ52_00115 [Thermoprotei archaeon]|nr:MAG: hypothetical protein DRJ52_00115 [Thermoprotei archaeon]